MISRHILIALTIAMPLVLAAMPAHAQTDLSTNQIITSLQGLDQAPAGLTAEGLRQMARENIQKYPGENPANRRPVSEQLSTLPQLTVEITFDLGSAAIRPRSYKTLGYMADALHHPLLLGYNFLVIGHTDARGRRERNLVLSQQRADAIRDVLVTTFRIAPARVSAVGLGEEQLRDPQHPDAAVNRRVQLINIGR